MATWIQALTAYVRAQINTLRADERGYTTETVVVTALLVALAIAVIAIIVVKVTTKATGISF